jgi:hypothetical protein
MILTRFFSGARIALISLELAQIAQPIISRGMVMLGLRDGPALDEVLTLCQFPLGRKSYKKLGMNGNLSQGGFFILQIVRSWFLLISHLKSRGRGKTYVNYSLILQMNFPPLRSSSSRRVHRPGCTESVQIPSSGLDASVGKGTPFGPFARHVLHEKDQRRRWCALWRVAWADTSLANCPSGFDSNLQRVRLAIKVENPP